MLTIVGLVAVYSASFVIALARFGDPRYYIMRQGLWAVGGVVLLIAAMNFDYRHYQNRLISVVIMGSTIVALIAVLVIGANGGGAQRWIAFGPVTIQPSEFAKMTVILYLAAWLAGKGSSLTSWEEGFFPFVLIIGSVSALIMLQPNLGTTLIIVMITVTMFYVAGASFAQMATLIVTGFFVFLLLALVEGYRSDRISTFLHPGDDNLGKGFQTLQTLIAIGNGGVTGLGLGASRAKFFYIPESHTDGIFAIIGEETGFIAAAAVLILFMLLMFRGYQIARRTEDKFGQLIATGITTWITVQALLNIGGITRVIPLTGVPLPFLSFGGNALAAVMLAMGVLISVARWGGATSPSKGSSASGSSTNGPRRPVFKHPEERTGSPPGRIIRRIRR